MSADDLLVRTHAARTDFLEGERALLEQLVREGQAPHTMFIGCSDSRVLAEGLTGARPGELFVVRVVANIVPPYGSGQHGVHAAVEFAVEGLRVPRIVVCGHTECGGLRALDRAQYGRMPGVADWMTHARHALERVDGRNIQGDGRHLALVEENVRLQMEHLRTYPAVARALAEDRVNLSGWVFDMSRLEMRWCDPTGEFHAFTDGRADS